MPLIFWILFLLLGGSALIAHLSKVDDKITSESNCHDHFLAFNENLKFPASKINQLRLAREAIKKKISEYFKNKIGIDIPKFWIQGSYKMGTVIRNQDDNCDVDIGVYFFTKPTITNLALHQNIARALEEHTSEKAKLKNKCVRIYYSNDFHIDLPVYFFDKKKGQIHLAVKSGEWVLSDPKLFRKWFTDQTRNKEQLVRIVRYFKSWSDNYKKQTKRKMPSGLAFTLWSVAFYEAHDRDDVAFLKTAGKLLSYLKDNSISSWECKMPVVPNDNIILKLNDDQKENFKGALKYLVEQSINAVSSKSLEGAINIWKTIFGKWF